MNFKDFKSVRIYVEKPNWKQWVIVKSANFLLYLLFLLYDEKEVIEKEAKDIIFNAYEAIIDHS